MSVKLSTAVRNARLDAIETAVGTAPILKIRTGAAPSTCATADAGTVLASLTLPSDWLAAAGSGAKALLGTWSATASAAGTAAHFRIYDSGGSTCHLQGTVGVGGADMLVDDVAIALGQTVHVTAFTLTDANA